MQPTHNLLQKIQTW